MFGIILGLLVLYHFISFCIILYHFISIYPWCFHHKPHPISLGLASPALALVAASNFSWRVARLEGDLQPCKLLHGIPKKRTGWWFGTLFLFFHILEISLHSCFY
jgi:apolipoprotein N-acyltransferase